MLADVDFPVLLIQGEDDQYGSRAQIDTIVAGIGGPVERLVRPDCRRRTSTGPTWRCRP